MRAKYPRFRVRCVVRGTRIRGLVSVASSADAASRRTSFLIFFLSFFLSFGRGFQEDLHRGALRERSREEEDAADEQQL